MAKKSRFVISLHITLLFLILMFVSADVDLFGRNRRPRQPPPSKAPPAPPTRPPPSKPPPAPPTRPSPSTPPPLPPTRPPPSPPPPPPPRPPSPPAPPTLPAPLTSPLAPPKSPPLSTPTPTQSRLPPLSTPPATRPRSPPSSATPVARPRPPPPSTPSQAQPTRSIDHYILVLTWPWGYCNTSDCSANTVARTGVPDRFTIRGLWPVGPPLSGTKVVKATNSMHDCDNGQPLDKEIILRLSSDLFYYWPDVITMQYAPSERFWEHEYHRHGKCCVPPLTQSDYFERPIKMLKASEILTLLSNRNILAGIATNVSEVIRSFSGRLHGDIQKPIVKCRLSSTTGNWHLTELYFCMDRSAQHFVNCSDFYVNDSLCGPSAELCGNIDVYL
ncbi:hypothetical protein Ancab_004650 [Ancistrocladus abbreviatus]